MMLGMFGCLFLYLMYKNINFSFYGIIVFEF